jgi:DNA-binding FrmR family transcriptional regulator
MARPKVTTGRAAKQPEQCAGHSDDSAGGPVLKRLSRIEGQVRGVQRMVEEGRYCIDVLTQLAAVHEALRSVGRQILENHMQTCVARAMRSGNPEEAERVGREMGELLERYTR